MSTPNTREPLEASMLGEHAGTHREMWRKSMKKRFFTVFFYHLKIPCQSERLKILSLISE
jgi:hypothetical protein